MSLVSTEWLEKNLKNVRIIDASWHMPSSKRNADKEFLKIHIENTVFFDLDKYSDEESSLPHMMPDKDKWEKIVSDQGIKNSDQIIIYDDSDTISSCRCWFTFIYFGHDPSLIHVLDGGLKKWKIEKRKTTTRKTKIINSNYIAEEKKDLVKNKKQIDENIINKNFKLIDARNKNRFEGKEPEFRKNVKSGSIPNSICLPYTDLINKNHTFKELKVILFKFNNIFGSKLPKDVVFSCGSGVTAAVLSLAYSLINNKYLPTVYDGSWAEYGKIK